MKCGCGREMVNTKTVNRTVGNETMIGRIYKCEKCGLRDIRSEVWQAVEIPRPVEAKK